MLRPCEELLDHPEALAKMPALYGTEKDVFKDKMLLVRFYHPLSRWSWYGIEYDPQKRIFFGWVDGTYPEWGYFSLNEMAFAQVKGVPIFWDMNFKPIRFGDLPKTSEI